MSQKQDPQASIENWELRAGEIETEVSQEQEKIIAEFKKSSEYTKVLEALGDFETIENPERIADRIATLYSQNGKNINTAFESVFQEPHASQLGIPALDTEEIQEIIAYVNEENQIDMTTTGSTEIPENFWEAITNEWADDNGIDRAGMKEKFAEFPTYPLLQRFLADGKISQEEFDTIQNNILESAKWDEELKMQMIINIQDPQTQDELQDMFKERDPEEARKEFFTDAKVPEGEKMGEQGHPITELIGENYRKIPDKEGKSNIEADTKLAIQTASNKVLEWKTTFKRNESFEKALQTIKDGNSILDMYAALETIHKAVNDSEGIKGRKLQDYIRKNKENGNEREASLSARGEKIRNMLVEARNRQDTQKVAQLEEVQQALTEEKKVEWWEGGMGWWDIDAMLEAIESIPAKAA